MCVFGGQRVGPVSVVLIETEFADAPTKKTTTETVDELLGLVMSISFEVDVRGIPVGKRRIPADRPFMVNKGKSKGLSRSHNTQSDQVSLKDAFVTALEAIPADDWDRTWVAGRTIMMRRTSKRVKEHVDKMWMSFVARLCTTQGMISSFFGGID